MADKKLFSYDLFDTVIRRKVNQPEDIFSIMEKDLSYPCFRQLRTQAERMARFFSDYEEISIAEIYQMFRQLTGDSYVEVERLYRIEVETEVKYSEGVSEFIKEINGLLDNGQRVIFISDMYLPVADIQRILGSVEHTFQKLPIYVSSDKRCTKRSGRLFKQVKDIEGVPYELWIHKGDNRVSDYAVPRALGISAELVRTDKTKCEIEEIPDRKTNIQRNYQSPTSVREIGSDLAAPILFQYVKWILSICEKCGIDRLYFLARDGFVLKRIADIIICNRGLGIRTKYIYASRQVWYSDDPFVKADTRHYIEEQVSLIDNHYAYVDLAGRGKSISKLSECLKDVLPGEIRAFYFYRYRTDDELSFTPFTYMEEKVGLDIEVLCRAPHGSLISYQHKGGHTIPVLSNSTVGWDRIGFDDYFHGIEEYTESASNDTSYFEIPNNDRSVCEFYLKKLHEESGRVFLSFIGDMPQDNENSDKPYAPKLSKKELLEISGIGNKERRSSEPYRYKGYNLSFSLKRMTKTDRLVYGLCRVCASIHERNRFARDISCLNKNGICSYNIILYTAGKRGQEFYRIAKRCASIKIVAWTDLQYDLDVYQKLCLTPIREAFSMDYDYVVIPMNKKGRLFHEIKRLLLLISVSEDKIISGEELFAMMGATAISSIK